MLRKLLILINLIALFFSTQAQNNDITPTDDQCGGETVTYELENPFTGDDDHFVSYTWGVDGGTISTGGSDYTTFDRLEDSIIVTWYNEPYAGDAGIYCDIRYWTGDDNNKTFITRRDTLTLTVHAITQPDDILGNTIVLTGDNSTILTVDEDEDWYVDEYKWTFTGTNDPYTSTPEEPEIELELSGDEYGWIQVEAYNEFCDETSTLFQRRIQRKIVTPSWYPGGYDQVMCNSTQSLFRINPMPDATTITVSTTGGFLIKYGSNWVTSLTVPSIYTSTYIKAPATNGLGSITVVAKHSSSQVFDSEPLTLNLWSGVFNSPYVTGTPDVCPGSLYIYTAEVPVGGPAAYSYSWTYPTGWSNQATWDNNIRLLTPQYNMTYGTVRASVTNECGSTPYSGITVYPGYCGGYFMALPNPGSEFIDIDVNPEKAAGVNFLSEFNISIIVTDNMGTVLLRDNVSTLPYKIETSKYKNGEYLITLLLDNKKEEINQVQTIKIIVSH